MPGLNPLPFQYRTRAPMIEHMRNDTMRGQLAEDHDRELEDYLGRFAAYGPFTTAPSSSIPANTEGVVTHTHNLNLRDPDKCVVTAQAMDGSWAAAASWRVTVTANTVTFNIINGLAPGGFDVSVVFRYLILRGV